MRFSAFAVLLASATLIQGIASAQAPALQSPPRQEIPKEWIEAAERAGMTVHNLEPGEVVTAPKYPDAMDVVLGHPNPYPEMIASGPETQDLVTYANIEWTGMQLLLGGKFDDLEAMASAFRTTDLRLASGVFKSQAFYEGLDFCGCKPINDEKIARLTTMAKRYVAAYPQSPSAIVIDALMRESEAWVQFRQAFGPNGTPQDMLAFHDGISDVASYLSHNWEIAKKDPFAYAMLSRLAMEAGFSPDTVDAIMKRVATEQPDYMPAWFAAADYATTKWFYSPGYAEHVAVEAADAAPEGRRDEIYARVIFHAWTHDNSEIFDLAPVNMTRFRKGVADLLAAQPTKHNFENYAAFACDMKDWDLAEPLLARMQVLASESYADFPGYIPCRVQVYYRHH